jgi:glycosyltransferase involved in cell wall biosynthesis
VDYQSSLKTEQNGLTVEPNDVNALKEAICKMIEDDDFRIRAAQKGFELSLNRISIETMMSKTIAFYNRLVNC